MTRADLIHSAFEAAARRAPDALAVESPRRRLSYGALDRHSARLAREVAERVSAAGVVAILADRDAELVAAMLACARAGRPFVVLDLAYPEARLGQLVQICRPVLALLAGQSAGDTAARLGLDSLAVDLDTDPGETAWTGGAGPSADAAAYLLFTSGSTGTPRCVAVSHRPLVHFTRWQARTFALTAADRFTLLSGLSHDPVLRDVFTPLGLGASLHIPAQETLTAPGALQDWFAETRPSVAHMTPPLGRLLTAGRPRPGRLRSLRRVFWGGDVLRRDLVDALAGLAPGCESVNFYGSTETPQAVAFHRVPSVGADERMPIGQAVDGFALAICDEAGGMVAAGEVGEIVVRSSLLSLGYVVDGRLPPPAGPAAAAYATGDIGRLRPDGLIELRGRRDDQVKVRGHRVELAEITAAALRAPGVRGAVTLNLGEGEAVRLCCFVEPADAAAPVAAAAVRARLCTELPAYMAPDAVEVLAALPLLPNGKIDRQALIRDRCAAPAAREPQTEPAGPVEAALVRDWRRVFRRDDIGPACSFADLHGDSLSYVNAYMAAEEALGAVPEGWTTMSIAELAATARPAAAAGRGGFADVESAILVRAVAIAAVVASHYQLIFSGGAATSALIWVSGLLFGRLQLREAQDQASAAPVGRLLLSLLLPLAVIEAPQIAVKFLTHYHAHLSSLFLYVDLLDFTGTPASGPEAYGGHEYLMWYIHCLFHIILIYGGLIFLFGRVLKLKRPVMVSAAVAVGLGLFGRFLLPAFFVPDFWREGVDPMSFFNHAPTTHLATFALAAVSGMLMERGRLIVLGLALAYAALSAPIFEPIDSLGIAAVAGVLAFLPKLRLPRAAFMPLYLVAGASFFIYLLHFKVLAVATRLHLPAGVAWPLALAGGVAAWSAWNWGLRRAALLWPRVKRWRPLAAPRPAVAADPC